MMLTKEYPFRSTKDIEDFRLKRKEKIKKNKFSIYKEA